MIVLELIVIAIGVIIFFIQTKGKDNSDKLSIKLVYWTVVLFISILFNTIMYMNYMNNYGVSKYLNLYSLIIFGSILLGYITIQTISPFKHVKKLINRILKSRRKSIVDEEDEDADTKLKQRIFEIFLETICWLSFLLTMVLDIFMLFIKNSNMRLLIMNNLMIIPCMLLMITLPIAIRQILYYLFSIRKVKYKKIPENEMLLNKKLGKENIEL